MKSIYSILLIAMALSFSVAYSQNEPKLLFSGENYLWQIQFYQENGIQPVYSLYEHNFVSSSGLTFNKKLMEASMDKIIPDKNQYGYGTLDWEGYIYNVLAGWESVPTSTYNKYINQYIAAISYAKILRPNIKWSIYYMPMWLYSQYSEAGMRGYDKLMPLYEKMDFLAPSPYVFYDNKTVNQEFVEQYIDANIRYSLELGIKLNKPVYCYVWHRYQPFVAGSPYSNANMLIPTPIFAEILTKIMNTVQSNKKVTGLIWWNCEDWLYYNQSGDPILTQEYKNVTNIDLYKKNILQTYLDVIQRVLNQ